MPFDLGRFVQAQDRVFEQVRRELRDGRKRSHWMWFVFPQLSGLGHSAMARQYAVASLNEAEAYLKHPILKPRLIECTELVNEVEGRSINEIFGSPDDLKFHSCMTLFSSVSNAPPVFGDALAKYFGGARDRLTTERLATRRVSRSVR
jgi:uncharacterized protein (DUF1810 family)